jgi:hypothetical protein
MRLRWTVTDGRTRYSLGDDSPEAAAERNVRRNPQPLCRDFVALPAPSEFWCETCSWNRPMHDDERHREAIAAELLRLNTGSKPPAREE